MDDQPYRRPKDEPLTHLLRLLGDEPVVRIIEGDEASAAWNAWIDTVPDNLPLT